jgi:hypothetical protein
MYDDPDSLAARHRTEVLVRSRYDADHPVIFVQHRASGQHDRGPSVLETFGEIAVVVCVHLIIDVVEVFGRSRRMSTGGTVAADAAGGLRFRLVAIVRRRVVAGRVVLGVFRSVISEAVVVVGVKEMKKVAGSVARLTAESVTRFPL